jgi:hypothetical protein
MKGQVQRLSETTTPAYAGQQADGIIHCVLIRAGPGKNRCNWPAAVLEKAAPLFSGASALLDHSWGSGSIRDTIGAWAGLSWNPEARAIEGDLHFLDAARPAYDLCKELIARRADGKPSPEIGISIDVGCYGKPAPGDRVEIEEIVQVYSVDLVTHPAAAGQLTRVVQDAQETTVPEPLEPPAAPPAPGRASSTLIALQEEQQRLRHQTALLECGHRLFSTLTNAADLPAPARDRLQASFDGRVFEQAELDTAVAAERDYILSLQLLRSGVPVGQKPLQAAEWTGRAPRIARAQFGLAPIDQIRAAAHRMLGVPVAGWDADLRAAEGRLADGYVRPFSGLREMYAYMTGDPSIQGRFYQRSQEAAMVGSDLPEILLDSMYKRLQADYAAYPDDWRKWTSVVPIKSLEEQSSTNFDGLGVLPSVAEGGTYTQVSITDWDAHYTPKKYGETIVITREMILRDDTNALTRILPHLARAAAFTVNDFVYGLVEDNGAIYDANALFLSVSRSAIDTNIISGALASATLAHGMRIMMEKRQGLDAATGMPVIWNKVWMIVPPALALTAAMLCGDEYNAPNAHPTDVPTSGYSFFKRFLGYIVAPWNASASKWFLVGDPADCPGLEVGFVNGRDRPELFLADDPRVGLSLTADQITYKVRLEFGAVIGNHRPFAGYVT